MDHLLDNLRESFPSRFLKYENELNKICIEEFGQEWDAKKQKLKGNRKTYTDKDGKRHLVDDVDVRHTCKGIFLKNWFEKTSANESFYYVLNEWIELEWGWSHEFDCFVLLEFIKSNDKYSFEDVINLVRCHKDFNETESEKKERLQSIKKEIDNKYKNIKEVQSSLGYFVRKYLNLKTQFIFDYFPKLEKKISKEAIFRKLDDERADYEKKQLDAKEYYLQDDTYNEPSDPVWRFKELQKMFSKCDMDWFRSSVIEAIKKISKEHKLEALKSIDPLSIKNVSILGSSTPVNFAIQGDHFVLSHETSPFYLARIYKVELQ